MKPKKRTVLDLPACHEVQIYYKRPLFNSEKKISNSDDANKLLREFIDLTRIDYKEFFWVVLLTNASQVVGISEVSVGSTLGVVTNYKEILQLALLTNASAIIVAHNHPSGKIEPSQTDRDIILELKKVCKVLEINLVDNLILTSERYYSFADEHLL